jgi:simple sugar transport system permease protein
MLVQGFNPGVGAAGIGIAILANGNPIGMIFASILFGALSVGGTIMGQLSGIPSSINELMLGFVMVFVILAYYVREKLEVRREKARLKKAASI